jgi:hypothetical protein
MTHLYPNLLERSNLDKVCIYQDKLEGKLRGKFIEIVGLLAHCLDHLALILAVSLHFHFKEACEAGGEGAHNKGGKELATQQEKELKMQEKELAMQEGKELTMQENELTIQEKELAMQEKELAMQEGKELTMKGGKEHAMQEGKELATQEGKELTTQEGK